MSWFLHVGLLSVLAAVFGATLLLAVYARPGGASAGFWNARILRCFGQYSYGIYVFHALFSVHAWAGARYVTLQWVLLVSHLPATLFSILAAPLVLGLLQFAILTTLSVAMAWLSWHLYEKHFLKLKARFA